MSGFLQWAMDGGLAGDVNELRRERDALRQRISELEAQNKGLEEENRCLKAQLEERSVNKVELTEEESAKRKLMETTIGECDCDFSMRVYVTLCRYLEHGEHSTLEEVCQYKMSEFLDKPAFGNVCANNLNYELGRFGLSLAPEDDEKMQRKIDKILFPSRAQLTKLTDLGLTEETLEVLLGHGYETVGDMIVYRHMTMIRLAEQVRALFTDSKQSDEFIEKIATLGFSLQE